MKVVCGVMLGCVLLLPVAMIYNVFSASPSPELLSVFLGLGLGALPFFIAESARAEKGIFHLN